MLFDTNYRFQWYLDGWTKEPRILIIILHLCLCKSYTYCIFVVQFSNSLSLSLTLSCADLWNHCHLMINWNSYFILICCHWQIVWFNLLYSLLNLNTSPFPTCRNFKFLFHKIWVNVVVLSKYFYSIFFFLFQAHSRKSSRDKRSHKNWTNR